MLLEVIFVLLSGVFWDLYVASSAGYKGVWSELVSKAKDCFSKTEQRHRLVYDVDILLSENYINVDVLHASLNVLKMLSLQHEMHCQS